MPLVQNTQALRDKRDYYFGSDRCFFSGLSVGSTAGSAAGWTNVSFSGTNYGFGADQGTFGQRIMLVPSGGNTAKVEFSFDSGTTVHGDLFPGDVAVTFDGMSMQGIAFHSNTASQQVRVWVY